VIEKTNYIFFILICQTFFQQGFDILLDIVRKMLVSFLFLFFSSLYWMNSIVHKPVMVDEVCEMMPASVRFVVDGTLGHGGHSLAMATLLQKKGNPFKILWIDIDVDMLEKAKTRLVEFMDSMIFVRDSYKNIGKLLEERQQSSVDFVLLDLWVNMEHYKDVDRGFSIRWGAKLDMRFDRWSSLSSYELINSGKKDVLVSAFVDYADFSLEKSEELANKIVSARKIKKIETTTELKELFGECWLWWKACLVIFQALRIEVNKEMQNLNEFLSQIVWLLSVGGRCAILSYHSVEDRLLKKYFVKLKNEWLVKLINKKVIKPHYTEVQKNRASRSAKLRVVEKI